MGAGGGDDQAGLLVMPDGAQGQLGARGDLADLHVLAVHARNPLVFRVVVGGLGPVGTAVLYSNVRVELPGGEGGRPLHRAEFEHLVRERLGATAAAQVFRSGPRLICVAGDYTRYDLHAVREHRRSIDLVRCCLFGRDLIVPETVATAGGRPVQGRPERRTRPVRSGGERIAELAKAADEVLLGLGDGITKVQRKQYSAYRRLQNFASLCPPQRTKVHVYLSLDRTQSTSFLTSPDPIL
nr:hypothetical protein [Streptomyces sp. WZ.A104]